VHFDIACTEVDELLAGERDEARSQDNPRVDRALALGLICVDESRAVDESLVGVERS